VTGREEEGGETKVGKNRRRRKRGDRKGKIGEEGGEIEEGKNRGRRGDRKGRRRGKKKGGRGR
jgi:hypothetical protein